MHMLYQKTPVLKVTSVAKVNFTAYNMVVYHPSFPNLSSPAAEVPGFSLIGMDSHIANFILLWRCGGGMGNNLA